MSTTANTRSVTAHVPVELADRIDEIASEFRTSRVSTAINAVSSDLTSSPRGALGSL